LFQCLANGVPGPSGQIATPNVGVACENVLGIATTPPPSIMGLVAKGPPLRKSLVIKYVRRSPENGHRGPRGPLAARIVCNSAAGIVTIPSPLMEAGIAKAKTLQAKIVPVECVNVSLKIFIFVAFLRDFGK
jgi:hypothetical protein